MHAAGLIAVTGLLGLLDGRKVCRLSDAGPVFGKLPAAPTGLVDELRMFVGYAAIAYCDASDRRARNRNTKMLHPHAQLDADIIVENTYALTYFNEQQRHIVTTFRGSDSLARFFDAASDEKAAYPGVPGATVTKNGLKFASSIRTHVARSLRALKGRYPDYRLVLTGHSLGGILATLMAPMVAEDLGVDAAAIRVITFNQPRAGNAVFATHFNHRGFNFTRVTNKNDPVHDHPNFDQGWAHVQREVHIDEGDNFLLCGTHAIEDPACSFKKSNSMALFTAHVHVADLKISPAGCSWWNVFGK